MTNIKKILVGIDYSEYSREAARTAVAMARSLNAEVIFLHVCEIPAFLGSSWGTYNRPLLSNFLSRQDELMEGSGRELSEFAREFSDEGVDITERVEKGYPFMETMRVAEEECVDLIALGTHGKSGMKQILIGSVAEKIVRKAPCSVLVVKMPSLCVQEDDQGDE